MPFELWNWADTAGAPQRYHGPMAQPRHPRRHPGAVQISGLSAERCDSRLRRRTGFRPDRQAARLHLFLYRRLCRRRRRAQRRPLRRPNRQCRCAWLDAGAGRRRAAGAADRRRFARHSGEGAQCARHRRDLPVDRSRRIGSARNPNSTPGSTPRDGRSPMPSSRHRRSSISRPPSSTAGCRQRPGKGWCNRCSRRLPRSMSRASSVPAVFEGTVGIHARALGGASLPLSERFLIGATERPKGT